MTSADSPPAGPGAIGPYNLLEKLDPAGPGELFRARDTRLGRTVTLRLLPLDFTPDQPSRTKLIETARSVIALSHPNVTAVFDAGEHEGRVFVVFEHITGESLRAHMAGGPVKVRRAVELAIQIADGVAEAHAAGFAHAGLSPDTIAITAKGRAKIPAFELAASRGFETSAGVARLRDYDSPEEARGAPGDDRSDIYSVGAVLYEMLTTRRPPHKGASAPSASNPHVPKELDDVVLKAAAPNPELRFQTAATLAAELRSLSAILDVRDAGSADMAAAAGTASLFRPVLLALAILAAVLLVALYFTR